jgi:hypothetical protein
MCIPLLLLHFQVVVGAMLSGAIYKKEYTGEENNKGQQKVANDHFAQEIREYRTYQDGELERYSPPGKQAQYNKKPAHKMRSRNIMQYYPATGHIFIGFHNRNKGIEVRHKAYALYDKKYPQGYSQQIQAIIGMRVGPLVPGFNCSHGHKVLKNTLRYLYLGI